MSPCQTVRAARAAGAGQKRPAARDRHDSHHGIARERRALVNPADGSSEMLTASEFDLLKVFVENPNRPLQRDWRRPTGARNAPAALTIMIGSYWRLGLRALERDKHIAGGALCLERGGPMLV